MRCNDTCIPTQVVVSIDILGNQHNSHPMLCDFHFADIKLLKIFDSSGEEMALSALTLHSFIQ